MNFIIITHVTHIQEQNQFFAYAPYVREMNVWGSYPTKITIVAPLEKTPTTPIHLAYKIKNLHFIPISNFNISSIKSVLRSVFKIPIIALQIYKAMRQADHIHLRCPGNIGLIGCFVQILFPNTPKTAKYAGNWDPKAKQPWSYRLQKWLLSNTFLTRNMQVLVYGEWEGSTKNVKPFFTATYFEADKEPIKELYLNRKINFVFVGTLSVGKNPLYAIQLVEALYQKGYNVSLDLYGEGIERQTLENYIAVNNLTELVFLKGNQNQETVKRAYQVSHFVLLPSQSEGWPKALAEGMFWGCVPIATPVSCVAFMLDYGKRGLLLDMNLENDIIQIQTFLNDESSFIKTRNDASLWSRNYTIDIFDAKIKLLLLDGN